MADRFPADGWFYRRFGNIPFGPCNGSSEKEQDCEQCIQLGVWECQWFFSIFFVRPFRPLQTTSQPVFMYFAFNCLGDFIFPLWNGVPPRLPPPVGGQGSLAKGKPGWRGFPRVKSAMGALPLFDCG